jgi:hypothetical protein
MCQRVLSLVSFLSPYFNRERAGSGRGAAKRMISSTNAPGHSYDWDMVRSSKHTSEGLMTEIDGSFTVVSLVTIFTFCGRDVVYVCALTQLENHAINQRHICKFWLLWVARRSHHYRLMPS